MKNQQSRSLWLHPAFTLEEEPDGSAIVSFGFDLEQRGMKGKREFVASYLVGGASGVVRVTAGKPRRHHDALFCSQPKLGPIARLADQWGLDRFDEARKANFPAPSGYDLYQLHEGAWHRLVHFDHIGQYVIAACWGVLTYIYPAFLSLPFLHFLGDKGSGKSQALDLLQELARDGQKVRPTPASVGDLIEARRPTLLMDQVDFLSEQMVDLLADSYRRGARRIVVLQPKGGRETREFETFGPKAFAGTQPLPDDLRDRAIILHMSLSPRRLPPVRPTDPQFQVIRAASYTWALREGWVFPSLREMMLASGPFVTEGWPVLSELAGRPYDLWLPFECLMEALHVPDADREAARAYYAQSQVGTVAEPPRERYELVEALWHLSNGRPSFTVTRSELERELNKASLDFEAPRWNGQKIGRQLSALVCVVRVKNRSADRGDRKYEISQPELRKWAQRYGLTE